MKQTTLLMVLLASSALLFNNCSKVETSALTLDKTQNAKLILHFYAQLDNTQDGLERVPNGTTAIVRINNSSFNPSASGFWTQTVTLDNGTVEIEVPTTNAGVTVDIFPVEFVFDQVQASGSVSPTIKKIYKHTAAESEANVKPNEIRTHQVTYNNVTSYNNFTETVDIKFELKANIDATTAPSEFVPSGTTVKFFTDSWSADATVGNLGRVDTKLPVGQNVSLVFYTNKTYLDGGNPVSKLFKFEVAAGTFGMTLPTVQKIDCGEGVLWE